jgi:hypothetical protein
MCFTCHHAEISWLSWLSCLSCPSCDHDASQQGAQCAPSRTSRTCEQYSSVTPVNNEYDAMQDVYSVEASTCSCVHDCNGNSNRQCVTKRTCVTSHRSTCSLRSSNTEHIDGPLSLS